MEIKTNNPALFNYDVYFVDKKDRVECMLVCALHKNIDWQESGLKLLSWTYHKMSSGQDESLSKIFNKHSKLKIDKRRRRRATRTINIGDIIVFDDVPWIVSSFGFSRVPQLLWDRVFKQEK